MSKDLDKRLERSNELLKKSTQESKKIEKVIRSIGDSIQGAIEMAIDGTTALTDAGKHLENTYKRDIAAAISSTAKGLKEQADFQFKILKGESASKQINDALLKNKAKSQALIQKVKIMKQHGLKIDHEQIRAARIAHQIEKDMLETQLNQTNNWREQKSFIGHIQDHLADMALKLDKSGTLSNIIKLNFKEAFNAANLMAAGNAMVAQTLISGVIEMDKIQTSYAKNFALSSKSAQEIQDYAATIANDTGYTSITYRTIHKTLEAVRKEAGFLGIAMRDDVVQEGAKLMKLLELSTSQTVALMMNAQRTGQHLRDQTKSMEEGVLEAEKMFGVTLDVRDTIAAAADVTGMLRLNMGYSYQEITKMVGVTKTLGMQMSDLSSISSNLLNFHTSIENELSAELFIGKSLNLERARGFALLGDYDNMLKEVLANVGSEYEILTMNVMAREKYAMALGMTGDKLADLVWQRGSLDQLEKDAIARGDTEMTKRLEERDLAQEMADLVEKIQTAFIAIADGPLGYVANLISNMLSSLGGFLSLLGMIAGIKMFGLIGQMWALSAANTAAATGAAANLGFMSLGAGLLIAIPLIASAIGMFGSWQDKSQESVKPTMQRYNTLGKSEMVTIESGMPALFDAGETVTRTGNFDEFGNKIVDTNEDKKRNDDKNFDRLIFAIESIGPKSFTKSR